MGRDICAFHPWCLLGVGNCERIGEERLDMPLAGFNRETCKSKVFRGGGDVEVVVKIWEDLFLFFGPAALLSIYFPLACYCSFFPLLTSSPFATHVSQKEEKISG
jgi:hypothetical protein